MTTEPMTADEVLLSFETLARPSRFISINGEHYELADDQDFSPYQHGRMERLRRRVISVMYGADGSELNEEIGQLALMALQELTTLLLPGAVGKTAMQAPKPTPDNPNPVPVETPVLQTLNTKQCEGIMNLFTPASAGGSAVDAIVRLLGMAEGIASPTTGDSSLPASTPSTAPPPVAAVTG